MNNLRAALTLTLEDKLSAGLDKLKDGLNRLKDAGKQITLGGLADGVRQMDAVTYSANRLTNALRQIETRAAAASSKIKQVFSQNFGGQSRAGAFAAAAEGYSVYAPIRQYADLENILRHTAITKGLSGGAIDKEVARLQAKFAREALETGQSSTSIAVAFQDLIQTGIAYNIAEELIGPHSRAATAYNISPEALGHAVAALNMNMGIGHEQMPLALTSMALASKEGRFKVADFSAHLPGMSAQLATLGMTGLDNARLAFAAMEIVMRNSADPGTGSANFKQFISDITSSHSGHGFALDSRGMSQSLRGQLERYHIKGFDITKLLENARKAGINPVDAVIGKIDSITRNLPPEVKASVLGAFFGNMQSRDTAIAFMMHIKDFMKMRGELAKADTSLGQRDFDSGFAAPKVGLDLTEEMLGQLTKRAGQGFLPVLKVMNFALDAAVHLFRGLDSIMPGVTNALIVMTGGTLAYGAALAAWGVIGTPIAAAFRMWLSLFKLLGVELGLLARGLITPMGALALLAVALTAAALHIYRHWDRFGAYFAEMWQGIQDTFSGFMDFLIGVYRFDIIRAVKGLITVFWGLKSFYEGLWGVVKNVFTDFTDWIDSWTGGAVTSAIERIKSAWSALGDWFERLWARITKPFDDFTKRIAESPFGKAFKAVTSAAGAGIEAEAGASPFGSFSPSRGDARVELLLRAEDGTSARVIYADPGVAVRGQMLDRGRTLGRQ